MRQLVLALAVGAGLAGVSLSIAAQADALPAYPLPGTASGAFSPAEQLLENARQNIAHGRADLALDQLGRLQLVDPDNGEALMLAVVANASVANAEAAEAALARLKTAHPDDAARIEMALQAIATGGKSGGAALLDSLGPAVADGVRAGRMAAAAGRYDAAATAYRAAVGDRVEALPISLQLEYYETLAGASDGLAEASTGLKRLYQATKDIRIGVAYAKALTYQPAARREGIDLLERLAANARATKPAADAWAEALGWLTVQPDDLARFDRYLARFPNDDGVRKARTKAARDLTAGRSGAPGPAATARARGFAFLEGGRLEDARAQFERALRFNGNDPDALGGLGVILLKEERFEAAAAALERAGTHSAKARKRWAPALASARFWNAYRQGQTALDLSDAALAENIARSLLTQAGGDRQSAQRLQADALLALGRPGDAEAAFHATLDLAPGDVGGEVGLFNALVAQGRVEDALEYRKKMSADARAVAADPNSLYLQAHRVAAARAVADGRHADAEAAYRAGLTLAPADAWLRLDYARLLTSQGAGDVARTMIDEMAAAPDATPEMLHAAILYYEDQDDSPAAAAVLARAKQSGALAGDVGLRIAQADMLARAGQTEEAADLLNAIALEPDLTASQRDAYGATRRAYIVQEADRLREGGAYRAGYDMIQPELAAAPEDRSLLAAVARLYADAGQTADAQAIHARILARHPGDYDALRGAIGAALQAGAPASADALLNQAMALRPDDPETYLLVGDAAAARGDRHGAEQAYETARALSLRTQPDRQTATLAGINRRIEAMRPATRHLAEGRFEVRLREGDPGLDRLTEVKAPLSYRYERGDIGAIALTATPIHLTAGSMDGDETNQRRFGLNPVSPTGAVVDPGDIDASGVGVSVAYDGDWIQADIGVTPLGFEIINPVGGLTLREKFENGLSVRLTAEQRAITDSVLSYAGVKDAATGVNYGGVVRSGATLAGDMDYGRYGAFASGGFYFVHGDDVESNKKLEANVGGFVRLVETPDEDLKIGLNLTYFGYEKNLGQFTFRHGGYFSPEDFVGLSVPVEYARREGRLSYRAGGAVGLSYFKEEDADVFPGDARNTALLINRLNAGALGATALTTYAGDEKTGVGFNLFGGMEYQVSESARIGAGARLDASADWFEGAAFVYLRQSFGGDLSAKR